MSAPFRVLLIRQTALPLESAEPALARGYLGMTGEDKVLGDEWARRFELVAATAVEVTGVASDGPAELSGLHVGDVIVAVNGRPTPRMDDLHRILAEWRAASPLKMTIVRGGEKREHYALPTDAFGY